MYTDHVASLFIGICVVWRRAPLYLGIALFSAKGCLPDSIERHLYQWSPGGSTSCLDSLYRDRKTSFLRTTMTPYPTLAAFFHSLLAAYVLFLVLMTLWGGAAFLVWWRLSRVKPALPFGRMGPSTPPAVLEFYPPWAFASFDVRWNLTGPRPVDIAKAILITFLPGINLLVMLPCFLICAGATAYRTTLRVLATLSHLATGDANRLSAWFFRPLGSK